MGGQHRSSSTRVAAVLGLVWLMAGSVRAQAPDDATLAAARQLGQEGVALYDKGDYADASDKLERAYTVVKVPTLGLWSARALEKLGKWVEASQRYREVTLLTVKANAPAILRSAQADAQKAYDALTGRIPQLTVEIEGATASEVTLAIDGKPVPSALVGAGLPMNPGARKLEAKHGDEVVTQDVTLAEGERQAVKLVFGVAKVPLPLPVETAATATPEATESASSQAPHESMLPWVVIGGGGALAVTGGVFIALALSAKSNVEGVGDGTRWSAVQSDYDSVPTYSTVGFVLLGTGVAAVAAGLVWKYKLLERGDASLSVEASATRMTLKGAF